MGRQRYQARVSRGHVAPPPPPPPQLAAEVPLLLRLERAVEDEFRPQLLARLRERIQEEDQALHGHAPRCPDCGRPMAARGRKATSFITRCGTVRVRPRGYRCSPGRCHERPLLTRLGVEAGHVSGALARLLALLGVVVPYELAAQLAHLFFGVTVCPMTVRAVQRLGAACEQYVEALRRVPAPLAMALVVARSRARTSRWCTRACAKPACAGRSPARATCWRCASCCSTTSGPCSTA